VTGSGWGGEGAEVTTRWATDAVKCVLIALLRPLVEAGVAVAVAVAYMSSIYKKRIEQISVMRELSNIFF